jgi:hypothetical protein
MHVNNNQSVAPDGPSKPPPTKKETWVAGKQEGQAGSPSYRQLPYQFRVGPHVGEPICDMDVWPSPVILV